MYIYLSSRIMWVYLFVSAAYRVSCPLNINTNYVHTKSQVEVHASSSSVYMNFQEWRLCVRVCLSAPSILNASSRNSFNLCVCVGMHFGRQAHICTAWAIRWCSHFIIMLGLRNKRMQWGGLWVDREKCTGKQTLLVYSLGMVNEGWMYSAVCRNEWETLREIVHRLYVYPHEWYI